MSYNRILTIKILVIFIFGCGGASNSDTDVSATKTNIDNNEKQLNVTILLDLSDRVVQDMQPSQSERDVQVVNVIVDVFKSNMGKKGTYMSNDKIKVLFSPTPNDPNINNIARSLNVDLEGLEPKEKKEIYDNIETRFEESIREIYSITEDTKNWVGSDVWRFFKYDVQELCIESEENYRNVLVLVTDGYLFHSQSNDRVKNRTAYITPTFLQSEGFRNNTSWREKFDRGDYGLISSGQSFDNLEIMVLEVNPSNNHRNDEDIIRAYIDKWFKEMRISNYVIYNTDLPENTRRRIENFFK